MVEEDGELDVVISKDLLDREKRKLAELKSVVTEKRKLVGKGTKEERAGFRGEASEASAAAKKQAKLVSDMKKKLREIEKKQTQTDNKIKNFFGKVGQFATNPQQFVTETLFDVLKDNRWIPILGTAFGLGLAIFKLMEKEFRDGGLFDLRVRVKDIVRSIVGLKNLMDIDAGEVFMSPDTRLTTMPPETSNTESLRDGHVKYNQLTLGYR